MNPGLVVKLRPTGPWRIGPDSGARNRVDSIFHSDTLYAAVTGALARMGPLEEWLEATVRQTPPEVCFSSCFPFLDEIGFIVPPRTIWPPTSPALLSARVRWKSARFVPLGIVQAMLSGSTLRDSDWSVDAASECLVPAGRPGPFRTGTRSNAAVDRLSGSAERHSTACIEFRAGAGLWTIVSFADDASAARWLEPVKTAFRLLADSGFGGERSRGWGRSEMPEFIHGELPEMILPPIVAAPPGEEPPSPEREPAPPLEEPPSPQPPVEEPPAEEPPPPEPEPGPSPDEPLPQEAREAAVLATLDMAPLEVPPTEPAPPVEDAPVEDAPAAEAPEPAADAEEPFNPAPMPEDPAALTPPVPDPEPHLPPPDPEPSPAPEPPFPIPAPEPNPDVPPLPEPEPEPAPAPPEPAIPEPMPPGEPEPAPAFSAAPPEPAPQPSPDPMPAPEPAPPAPEPVPQPTHEPLPTPSGVHAHWLLSLFSPAASDAVDWSRGSYTLVARGGRIESPVRSGELKKQLPMIAEGSVLYASAAPRGAAPDVAPDGFAHPVYRSGFAVSIQLPEVG